MAKKTQKKSESLKRRFAELGIMAGAAFFTVQGLETAAHEMPEIGHDLRLQFSGVTDISGEELRERVPEIISSKTWYQQTMAELHRFAQQSRTSMDFRGVSDPSVRSVLVDNHPLSVGLDTISSSDLQDRAHQLIESGFDFNEDEQNPDLRQDELRTLFHIIEGLSYNGLTDIEDNFVRQAMDDYTPSETYQSWEQDRLNEALSNIQNDQAIQQALLDWKAPTEYESLEDAEMQYVKRWTVIQSISNHVREAFGLSQVAVMILPFPEELPIRACYMPHLDALAFNYSDGGNVLDDFDETLLQTILEEVKHSVDMELSMQMAGGEIDIDHPAFEHAAMILLGQAHYYLPEKEKIFGIETGQFVDLEPYLTQYVERNAKNTAENMAGAILEGLEASKPVQTANLQMK